MVQSCSQYDYPADDPPPPSTIYSINFFNPPSVYRVNEDKLFTINIEPLLNGETGKFKMYFEIEHSGIVLGRSNFVFFDENTPGIKTLEWGGGDGINFGLTFDYGDCDIVAYLEKYDLFPNPNKTRETWTKKYGSNQVRIYHFNDDDIPAANRFDVEIDYQEGQNIRNPLNFSTVEGAFDPCLARFNFLAEEAYGTDEGLDSELILDDNDAIYNYINANKDVLSNYYLCSIKGFKDDNGNTLNIVGKSVPKTLSNTLFASLVAFEKIFESIPSSSDDIAFHHFYINKVTIHEFGHQISLGSNAHDDHDGNNFCVMHSMPWASFNPQAQYIYGRSFYVNSHFCVKHINEILNNL
ncbi:hypothetical protein YTPLAS21_21300 [Candidatus Nitrosocosmicus sp.]|nr:hypothetical protein YTPLAS21_21300 [Candidatus Nitrosocosmicus sp.]